MASVKKDPVAEYTRLLRRPPGGIRVDDERITTLQGELYRLAQELAPTPRRLRKLAQGGLCRECRSREISEPYRTA